MMQVILCINPSFSAKGVTPYQPGATPQDMIERQTRAESPHHHHDPTVMVRAFSPDLGLWEILGRCPRLVWHRAFGPQEL